MNQQMPSTNFEERLLAELRAVVVERGAEEAASASASADPPARRWAPKLALGTGAVCAAAAAALIVTGGGGGTTSAYAVEPQANGDVSVEIRSLKDADGLEQALQKAGIPADVNYLATGMACREPRFQPATAWAPDGGTAPGAGKVTSSLSQASGGGATFTISRDAVGPGETLVLTAAPGPGGAGDSLSMEVAEGAVAACRAVPAPASEPADTPENAPGGAAEGPTTSRAGGPGAGASEKGFSTGGPSADGG